MQIGPLVGRGRTARVYAWGEGKVVKLFYEWFKPELVKKEYDTNLRVEATGLPVPVPYEIVVVNGCQGIIYSRVEGASMLKCLTAKPWTMLRLSRVLAEEHARIHGRTVAGLPLLKDVLHKRIAGLTVSSELREKIIERLADLPDGYALCHYDFHPDNVIMSPQGPIVIDWNNALLGDPLADVARTALLLTTGEIVAATPVKWLLGIARKLAQAEYLKHYQKITGATREAIDCWMVPVVAERLAEGIDSERVHLLNRLKEYGIS